MADFLDLVHYFFQIVVHMSKDLQDYGLLMESVSRARERVILVTGASSRFRPLLECANKHPCITSCDVDSDSIFGCQFIGSTTSILEKDKVGTGVFINCHDD